MSATTRPARLRALAAAMACAVLAACGTAGDSPVGFALRGIASSLGAGQDGGAAGEAALEAQLNRAALDAATRPLLLAELPSRDARATLVIGGQNREHVTWIGADGVGLTLKGGVLTGTRGLGADLLTADTAAAEAALARRGGQATRVHRYLDGLNRVRAVSFACSYTDEGPAVIEIVGRRHATRQVAERCAAGRVEFVNRYWFGTADGFAWQSVQWIAPGLGSVTLKRLVR